MADEQVPTPGLSEAHGDDVPKPDYVCPNGHWVPAIVVRDCACGAAVTYEPASRGMAIARDRDALRAALTEAIAVAVEGWSYAGPYFQGRWNVYEQLSRLRKVLDAR